MSHPDIASDARTYHVVRRLPRRGGNQWYKDRSERDASNICGAARTLNDIPWRDRTRFKRWTRDADSVQFVPCVDCQTILSEDRPHA